MKRVYSLFLFFFALCSFLTTAPAWGSCNFVSYCMAKNYYKGTQFTQSNYVKNGGCMSQDIGGHGWIFSGYPSDPTALFVSINGTWNMVTSNGDCDDPIPPDVPCELVPGSCPKGNACEKYKDLFDEPRPTTCDFSHRQEFCCLSGDGSQNWCEYTIRYNSDGRTTRISTEPKEPDAICQPMINIHGCGPDSPPECGFENSDFDAAGGGDDKNKPVCGKDIICDVINSDSDRGTGIPGKDPLCGVKYECHNSPCGVLYECPGGGTPGTGGGDTGGGGGTPGTGGGDTGGGGGTPGTGGGDTGGGGGGTPGTGGGDTGGGGGGTPGTGGGDTGGGGGGTPGTGGGDTGGGGTPGTGGGTPGTGGTGDNPTGNGDGDGDGNYSGTYGGDCIFLDDGTGIICNGQFIPNGGDGNCTYQDGVIKCGGKGEEDWLDSLKKLADEILKSFMDNQAFQLIKDHLFFQADSPMCTIRIHTSIINDELNFCPYEDYFLLVGRILVAFCLVGGFVGLIRRI